MSQSMNDQVVTELGESGLGEIAGLLGVEPGVAKQAVLAAVPALVGGLAANSAQPEGANALFDALGDHKDEKPASDIAALAGGGIGGAILGHVLGGALNPVADGIAKRLGVSPATARKVLQILAPIVMALLAKRAFGKGQDADGVAQDLKKDNEENKSTSGIGDLIENILGTK